MRFSVLFCAICFFKYGDASSVNVNASVKVGNINSNVLSNVQTSYRSYLSGTIRDHQALRTDSDPMKKIKDMILNIFTDPKNSDMECCRTAIKKALENIAKSVANETNAQYEAIIDKAKKDADEASKKAAEAVKKAQEEIKKAEEEIQKAQAAAKDPANAKNNNPNLPDNNTRSNSMDQIYDVYVNIPGHIVKNLTNSLNNAKGLRRRGGNVIQRDALRSRPTVVTSTVSTSYTPTTEESIWYE